MNQQRVKVLFWLDMVFPNSQILEAMATSPSLKADLLVDIGNSVSIECWGQKI